MKTNRNSYLISIILIKNNIRINKKLLNKGFDSLEELNLYITTFSTKLKNIFKLNNEFCIDTYYKTKI